MEDYKCGRIPPCYGGKKFRIHEELEKIKAGEETHDMVYELNKQMCDLERGLNNDFLDMSVRIADKLAKDVVEGVRTPDWAKNMLAGIPEQLSRAEYEILEEILKEKNRFMEEKKTKKMTKAEAFEHLKGKKVRTCGEPRLLEKKLMECGYRWMRGVTWENDDYEDFWAYFMGYDGLITFVDIECSDYYECHDFEDISADDILSIEIVEEENEPLDKWDEFARCVAKVQEKIEDDEVCIITKGNFLTMTK